ncbi:hypothetical protein PA99_1986 [Pseudomonas aeruginosa PA99]|nr:hypothetical protein PA99_1986 [Pseudomonas aeruginosa PA99]
MTKGTEVESLGRADPFGDAALDGQGMFLGAFQGAPGGGQRIGVGIGEGAGDLLGTQGLAGEALQPGGVQRGAQVDRAERPRAHQRDRPYQLQQRFGDQAGEGVDTEGGVVVVIGVEQRIDAVPVLAEQLADQQQAVGEPVQAVEGDVALQQQVGYPKVLATAEQFAGQRAYARPLRRLGGQHGIAHLALGLALGDAFEFEERGVVLQIVATGRVRGYGSQQNGYIQHGDDLPIIEAAARPSPSLVRSTPSDLVGAIDEYRMTRKVGKILVACRKACQGRHNATSCMTPQIGQIFKRRRISLL